jgi:hypothetical protein
LSYRRCGLATKYPEKALPREDGTERKYRSEKRQVRPEVA